MSKKNSVNPATAAIAGIAVGAAAGAAAVALSDKNTRKKLEKKLDDINQQTHDIYDKASKKFDQAVKSAEPKFRNGLNKMTSNTEPSASPKSRAKSTQDSIVDETAEQIEEMATKGGEVIHYNLPEK